MPAQFCQICVIRNNCIKICEPLEKFLRKRKIGGYSRETKRQKEVLVNPMLLEGVANDRAFRLKYGRRYFKNKSLED